MARTVKAKPRAYQSKLTMARDFFGQKKVAPKKAAPSVASTKTGYVIKPYNGEFLRKVYGTLAEAVSDAQFLADKTLTTISIFDSSDLPGFKAYRQAVRPSTAKKRR